MKLESKLGNSLIHELILFEVRSHFFFGILLCWIRTQCEFPSIDENVYLHEPNSGDPCFWFKNLSWHYIHWMCSSAFSHHIFWCSEFVVLFIYSIIVCPYKGVLHIFLQFSLSLISPFRFMLGNMVSIGISFSP